MSATPSTITPPASTVRTLSGSELNIQPSKTATIGLTNAYVPTVDVRAFLSNQRYAVNATMEPTTTR